MSFDSLAESPVGKVVNRVRGFDQFIDPLNLFKKREERTVTPTAPPPTKVESDIQFARLDARERLRRQKGRGGGSSGLGTPQLSQPSLSQRLG